MTIMWKRDNGEANFSRGVWISMTESVDNSAAP